MRRQWTVAGIAILAVIAAGFVYLAVREQASSHEMCQICKRPVHERSRTAGFLGTERELFCCPACAFASHRQSGQAVRITELTDFATDTKLEPQRSFLVRGSDVNLCSHRHSLVDASRQSYTMEYDRCSPSVLAFANKGTAQAFAREHGGAVLSFGDFAATLEQ